MTPLVQLTDAAQARLRHLIRIHAQQGVRLNVGESELGGLRFWFEFVAEIEPDDLPAADDIILLVRGLPDGHAGVVVDFIDEGMDSRFVFTPLEPSGGCGCNTGNLVP